MNKKFEYCETNLANTDLIQNFGAVCRVSRNNEIITHSSENFEELTGIQNPLGQKMSSVFGSDISVRLNSLPFGKEFNERWNGFIIFGRSENDFLILEIEPAPDMNLQYKQFWLQKIVDKEDAVRRVLEFLSAASGCERTMLYEFLSDGTGCVTGEVYHGDGDRYLGLRYPATDIPRTARKLYIQNSYRYIYDVSANPVKIGKLPEKDLSSLDLTHVTLRNVSPFHIAYLKNMGVGCAFSLSITVNGELVGLFSLHNSTPKFLPYLLREKLSEAVKNYLQALRTLDYAEKMKFIDRYKFLADSFCQSIIDSQFDDLSIDEALKMMEASGLIVNIDDEWRTFGRSKISEHIKRIKEQKADFKHPGIFMTDCVSSLGDEFRDLSGESAGLFCIWFRNRPTQKKIFCIFVKPEAVQEVVWGSRVSHYEGEINPVNSFGQWREEMYLHSEKWSRRAEHFAQGILASGLVV